MSSPLPRTCLALACALPACCVAAATRVLTPRGDVLAGWLAVGDLVHSVDVTSGELRTTRVVQVRRATRECVALRWPGGALVCTPDHPLYCPETATYRPASDWITGPARALLVVSASGVGPVAVTAADSFAGVHEVLDLTLDREPHNFVAADVVVHNKSPVEHSASGAADGPTFVLGVGDVAQYRVHVCYHDEDADYANLAVHIEADHSVIPAESFLKLTTIVEDVTDTRGVPLDRDVSNIIPGGCIEGALLTFKATHNYPKSTDGEITVSFSVDAYVPVDGEPDADATVTIEEV